MKWLILLTFCASSWPAWAQTAADITAEPHYSLLLQNDQARVFSFALPPSEQVYVRYEHNFLFIPIQDGELVVWPEGASPVPHFRFHQGEVHFWVGSRVGGMRNDGPTEFQAVVVEFLNPKVTSYQYNSETGAMAYAGGGISPPIDPRAKFTNTLAMGAASVSDVQLLAGDSFPPPPKEGEELLIAATDVDLKGEGDTHIRRSAGEVLWIPAGRKWDLSNSSNAAIRFAAVSFWKQEPK